MGYRNDNQVLTLTLANTEVAMPVSNNIESVLMKAKDPSHTLWLKTSDDVASVSNGVGAFTINPGGSLLLRLAQTREWKLTLASATAGAVVEYIQTTGA